MLRGFMCSGFALSFLQYITKLWVASATPANYKQPFPKIIMGFGACRSFQLWIKWQCLQHAKTKPAYVCVTKRLGVIYTALMFGDITGNITGSCTIFVNCTI